jgi:hypothetical protein
VLLQSKEIGTIVGNLTVEGAWPKEWPTISSDIRGNRSKLHGNARAVAMVSTKHKY